MHTDRDPQQHGPVEIQIDGGASNIPYSLCCATTAIARERGLYPAHMADVAGCLKKQGCGSYSVKERIGHEVATLSRGSGTVVTSL